MPLPGRLGKQTREQVLSILDKKPDKRTDKLNDHQGCQGLRATSSLGIPVQKQNSPFEDSLFSIPLSCEEARMCEREMMSASHRGTLHSARVDEEMVYYLNELRRINLRIMSLESEIDNITLELGKLVECTTNARKKNIRELQHLYTLERLQKKEEIIRLRDQFDEITKLMRLILIKHEDKRKLVDFRIPNRLGGKRARTNRVKLHLRRKRTIKGKCS
jgi:hypothetical protein